MPDPTDARARLVRITARGHDAIAVARAVQDEIEAEWSAHLGPAENGRLRRSLLRLREITDPWA